MLIDIKTTGINVSKMSIVLVWIVLIKLLKKITFTKFKLSELMSKHIKHEVDNPFVEK